MSLCLRNKQKQNIMQNWARALFYFSQRVTFPWRHDRPADPKFIVNAMHIWWHLQFYNELKVEICSFSLYCLSLQYYISPGVLRVTYRLSSCTSK